MDSRTVPREILVNHVGFVPIGGKHCVVRRPRAEVLRVLRLWDGKVVLRGRPPTSLLMWLLAELSEQ